MSSRRACSGLRKHHAPVDLHSKTLAITANTGSVAQSALIRGRQIAEAPPILR